MHVHSPYHCVYIADEKSQQRFPLINSLIKTTVLYTVLLYVSVDLKQLDYVISSGAILVYFLYLNSAIM